MHIHIEAQDDRYTVVLELNKWVWDVLQVTYDLIVLIFQLYSMLIPSNFNSLSYDKDGNEVITKVSICLLSLYYMCDISLSID